MGKLTIGEIARMERLRSIRGWCCGIGIVFLLLTITAFPYATRNPGSMAMSAFAPYREIGLMAWMVLPLALIGALFFICAIVITWKIKKRV